MFWCSVATLLTTVFVIFLITHQKHEKYKKNDAEQKQKQQLEVLELKKLAVAERTGFQCSIFREGDPTFTVLKWVRPVKEKKG